MPDNMFQQKRDIAECVFKNLFLEIAVAQTKKLPGMHAQLEMRLSEIKLYLYETIGQQFESLGYKFKKTDFTFKKKKENDYIQFTFVFYDYTPLRYEINFSILVMNEKIQRIKEKLPIKPTKSRYDIQSVHFYLGDYVTGAREYPNNNMRRNFSYRVTTTKDLFSAGEQIKMHLQNEILHEVEQMFTIEGVAKFFQKRGIWWSVSSLFLNNVLAELISTKLAIPKDYEEVYGQIHQKIQEKVGIAFPAGLKMKNGLNVVEVINHKGPHPEVYHNIVYTRLVQAPKGLKANTTAYKNAVVNTLDKIGRKRKVREVK